MHVVVLAAGLGTRFGGIKQLAAVGPNDESIMDLLLARAAASGVNDAVVIIRSEIERDVVDHFSSRPAALPIRFVDQPVPPHRDKPLGTADAVLRCRDALTDPFMVVNADDLYPSQAFELLARALASDTEHALIAFRLRNTVVSDRPVSRALVSFDDETGHLRSIDERHAVAPSTVADDPWVSMNMWGFQTSILDDLAAAVDQFVAGGAHGEVLLPDVVAHLAATGTPFRVVRCEERCIGITYAEDVPIVRNALT